MAKLLLTKREMELIEISADYYSNHPCENCTEECRYPFDGGCEKAKSYENSNQSTKDLVKDFTVPRMHPIIKEFIKKLQYRNQLEKEFRRIKELTIQNDNDIATIKDQIIIED